MVHLWVVLMMIADGMVNNMQDLTNYEPFFKMYHKRDIVYPNAVARHFSISIKEAYEKCEEIKHKGIIKNLYMVRCPICNHSLPQRYYSIMRIDDTLEQGCTNCGNEFLPNLETDIFVYYEKE